MLNYVQMCREKLRKLYYKNKNKRIFTFIFCYINHSEATRDYAQHKGSSHIVYAEDKGS